MFIEFKKQVSDNFNKLSKERALFYKTVDRDKIWEEYLNGVADPGRNRGPKLGM